MSRSWVALGVVLLGLASALPVSAQGIQPASHVYASSGGCAEPNRIVVQMPPPRVEVQDRCAADSTDSSCKRCQLLPRHNKQHDVSRDSASGAQMLFAPVSLPAMVIQAAPAAQTAAVPALTQQFTHDFTAIRHAQDMEARAAALEAQIAARNAMVKAENDYLCRIMERNQQRMQALANNCGAGANPPGDGVPLGATLKNLNDRLDQLERLVLEHNRVLKNSNPLPK